MNIKFTAKEQAIKLVSDYERYLPDGDWDTNELAKKLSQICIYEIIESHKAVRIASEISARDVAMIDYWNAVKTEIENI